MKFRRELTERCLLFCLAQGPSSFSLLDDLHGRALHERLVALLRLMTISPRTFARLVKFEDILRLTGDQDASVSSLASCLLDRIFPARSADSCSQAALSPDNSSYDVELCDGTCNARYFDLFEFLRRQKITSATVQEVIWNAQEELPCHIIDVGGHFLLSFSRQDKRSASALVNSASTKDNIAKISKAMGSSRFILLVGPEGCGRKTIVQDIVSQLGRTDDLVRLHVGPQTDVKALLGSYTFDAGLTTAEWSPGALTTALQTGRILCLEGLERATSELMSLVASVIKRGYLEIPGRQKKIVVSPDVLLFALVPDIESHQLFSSILGKHLWTVVSLAPRPIQEYSEILLSKYSELVPWMNEIITTFQLVGMRLSAQSRASREPSMRDLLKWCKRIHVTLMSSNTKTEYVTADTLANVFADALDLFLRASSDIGRMQSIASEVASIWQLSSSQAETSLVARKPVLLFGPNHIRIGRACFQIRDRDTASRLPLAHTKHTLSLLEQVTLSVCHEEPVLLVGETGTGKTSIVQALADMANIPLHVVNLSQQTDSGDLLGGYKPINLLHTALELLNSFEALFERAFPGARNTRFSLEVKRAFKKQKWSRFNQLLKEAIRAAIKRTQHSDQSQVSSTKRRRIDNSTDYTSSWHDLMARLDTFSEWAFARKSIKIAFVEGLLVRAMQAGHWILLDEINLAEADVLDCLTGLLESGWLLLAERGDTKAIQAHAEFRLFGCMNPATDVGKRDLPANIRGYFSEYNVSDPGEDFADLLILVENAMSSYSMSDTSIIHDVAALYQETRRLERSR